MAEKNIWFFFLKRAPQDGVAHKKGACQRRGAAASHDHLESLIHR